MLEAGASTNGRAQMIPSQDYKTQSKLYSRHGCGFWKIIAYCESPTVTMENMLSGQRETFGINGLAADSFEPIGELPPGFVLLTADKEEFRKIKEERDFARKYKRPLDVPAKGNESRNS